MGRVPNRVRKARRRGLVAESVRSDGLSDAKMSVENLEINSMDAGSVSGSKLIQLDKWPLRVISALLFAVGTLLFALSFAWNEFRDVRGAFTGKFVLPLSAGVGLAFLGAVVGTKWPAFAAWFCGALVGEAAALQLIGAGRLIHFQHYRLPSELLEHHGFELILVVVLTIIVGNSIRAHFLEIWRWLRREVGTWKLVVAMIFLALASAAVTPDVRIYSFSLAMGAWIQIVSLGAVILMVWSVPETSLEKFSSRINALLDGVDGSRAKGRSRLDRFAVAAAIWVMLLAAFLAYFVYQAYPHVPDEAQYLFQARYMAAGQLTVQAPQVPEAFRLYMVPYLDDRWYGIFPPGWPAMLAVGVWVRVDWLVNPILAGICLLLAYIFFQQLYDKRTARIAVILLSCSPWFIFMGMSYMPHMFTLATALGAAVIVLNSFVSKRSWTCLPAGALIGVVSLVRPLDGAIVAALLGVAVLVGSHSWRQRIISSINLVVGTIVTAATVLPYDRAVTGNALLMPTDAYYTKYFWPNAMALGFGPDRGFGWGLDALPGHSLLEAVINAALNVSLLQTELFGWGVGSLLIAALFIASRSSRKRDAWAVVSIAAVVGAYGLFWYSGGPDFGARYWFLTIIPLIALTVRAIEWLSRTGAIQGADRQLFKGRVTLAVVSLCLMTLICYIPWRAADKYYQYLGIDPGIQALAKEREFGKSLVLIRGDEYRDYQSAWTLNPVNFEGDSPIFAFDRDAAVRTRLLQVYHDRKVWVVDGPSIADGNYRVAAGPLNGDQLLGEMGK